jgi:endonuclease YncB( thermonuclease family)
MLNMLRVRQRQRSLRVASRVVWLLLIAVPILVQAAQCTGNVVGISDGDTISVLREGKAVKVRL